MLVNTHQKYFIIFLSTLIIMAGAVSCGGVPGIAAPTPTVTPAPTPTERPMAAHVNGVGILISEYQTEMQRYQAAVGQLGETYDEALASQEVMDELVDQTLLAQAAGEQGHTVDDAAVQAELDSLTQNIGGSEALQSWLAQNFYTDESFRIALKRNMAASWMKDQIAAGVPTRMEQVHARQILVDSQDEAESVLRQLQVGSPFEDLAYTYDELTGGELGWFPRGYLLQPDVENAAFSLEVGSFSGIISTSYGYHIIEVIEKEADHLLSPDALLFMQHEALNSWLEEKRAQGTIELSLP